MKTYKTLGKVFSVILTFLVGAFVMVAISPAHAMLGGLALTGIKIAVDNFAPLSTGCAYVSLISGEPITFIPKQASQGILEPMFARPELSELFTIYQDIVAEEHIPFLGRLNKITRRDDGCGTGKTDKTLDMDEVVWEPKKNKIWLHQCADDLDATYFVWAKKKGIDVYDLNGTTAMQYIMEVIEDGALEDAVRISLLGDTSIDDYTSGGILADAAEIANYNQNDGLFKTLFALGAPAKKYSITANAGVSKSAQLSTLASNEALLAMRALLTTCDPRLRASNNKLLFMTTTLFDNWITYKESQNLDMSFVRQDTNFSTDVYRGVKIFAVDLLDRFIQADFSNDGGTTYYRPHRMVLADKSYLALGFDSMSAVSKFKVWLNDDTEEMNVKGGYKSDFKLLRDYMICGAY